MAPLLESVMDEASDPYDLFDVWYAEAKASEPADPNAMTLATTTPDGFPSVRVVLLKGLDRRGFVFYTNLDSRKGLELKANPRAALCFHWKSLKRQVRIEGPVSMVTDAEADAYFAGRPRDSRIGAWASDQSRPLDARSTFEARIREYDAKFPGETVPRPPFWSGFRVTPTRIEFWQDREFRLHDRLIFTAERDGWTTQRLYP
ncbi:pyridoxine/pyridoxamine 5'-phosphate oxidase [Aliidongia dinghuensis]|uniref:Pyridoxine/pyridoxamine 5'-phosphate oxidase n=1 Tax=Aliidongia dinghuensis TaxID=1867774 RepID=A0A8J2Z0D0_9PROT|nr:pyridoxamine 5'-phosphate oxidase [Aliidongia dinghuensis]GGF41527.1 pyridoxine/pyridoxamine 5'-phosphate oxidase [Aliidongia dinghuensis]